MKIIELTQRIQFVEDAMKNVWAVLGLAYEIAQDVLKDGTLILQNANYALVTAHFAFLVATNNVINAQKVIISTNINPVNNFAAKEIIMQTF